MNRKWHALVLIVIATASGACAQTRPVVQGQNSIYVLNEMAGNGLMLRLPAVLYEIGLSNGQILSEMEVAPGGRRARDKGLDFMLPDYERRIIALGAPAVTPNQLIVVSFDSPSAPVHLAAGVSYDGVSVINHFISEGGAAHGLNITLAVAGGEGTRLLSVPVLGGGASGLDAEIALKSQRLGGFFGTVWDHPGGIDVRVQDGANLFLQNGPKELVDLGVSSPRSVKMDPRHVPARLYVKSDAALVVQSLGECEYSRDGLGSSIHRVYSNSTRTWRALNVPGSSTRVRSFGRWLAFVVSEAQPWAVPKSNVIAFDPGVQRVSVGQAGRVLNLLATYRGEAAASMDDLFAESTDWFPGVLLLYDVQTGRLYRMETGQGDSEVVLIDGNDVYYRVNTSLYRAKIGADSVGSPALIVSDPAIGNVHCAFISR